MMCRHGIAGRRWQKGFMGRCFHHGLEACQPFWDGDTVLSLGLNSGTTFRRHHAFSVSIDAVRAWIISTACQTSTWCWRPATSCDIHLTFFNLQKSHAIARPALGRGLDTCPDIFADADSALRGYQTLTDSKIGMAKLSRQSADKNGPALNLRGEVGKAGDHSTRLVGHCQGGRVTLVGAHVRVPYICRGRLMAVYHSSQGPTQWKGLGLPSRSSKGP